ncbi:phospholipase C [Novosphingobium rosa]|uniref:phospholipase C n=1 Tax=Novosphingobium rosa TaxID=76978 RepID=UPI00082D20D8|nr:alkaline phosphatase family protein [Novosphingobium rosa]
MTRKNILLANAALLLGASLLLASCNDDPKNTSTGTTITASNSPQNALTTVTPIKHLVVIYGENQSFDHYFGTYPQSMNPSGEPTQAWATPANKAYPNNYLAQPSLLNANPNMANAKNQSLGYQASYLNPFRIDRAQFNVSSQNHAYLPEQQASDNGLMDAFPYYTGSASSLNTSGQFGTKAQVLGYFDGNTVTAMWNYAQNYAMSDNAWTETFGPSTPGAIEAIAGQNNGAVTSTGAAISSNVIADGQGGFSATGDADPTGDTCSSKTGATFKMTGQNIGDLLNAAGITWGGFMGGFDLTATNANGSTGCTRSTVSPNTGLNPGNDYSPHHAWFQYYASTANLLHTRPSATSMIGYTDPTLDAAGSTTPVHHQYDYNDFITSVSAGNFPSVSYIKAPYFQDAHPGNSNPLDEQAFVTTLINFLMQQPDWQNTAVIIAYDDSDGWYDHQSPTITTSSSDATYDAYTSAGQCGATTVARGVNAAGASVNGRCGPGSRTPFMVISPYARQNYIDSNLITQSSIVRFIEDNWLGGKRLGNGSHDATAGDIRSLFDFTSAPRTGKMLLNTGTGVKSS